MKKDKSVEVRGVTGPQAVKILDDIIHQREVAKKEATLTIRITEGKKLEMQEFADKIGVSLSALIPILFYEYKERRI